MYVSHYSVTLQLAALVPGMPTRSPHGHPLLLESALIRHFHHLFPHPHLHLVLVAQHLVLPLNELLLHLHPVQVTEGRCPVEKQRGRGFDVRVLVRE